MERYIRENQKRDILINPNQWWLNFEGDISNFYFVFISGNFKGNFSSQLERISQLTGVNGAVLGVESLLLLANSIQSGHLSHSVIEQEMFKNTEYILFSYADKN